MITKHPFGTSFLYRIADGPFQAEIIPQGAAVRSLLVPGRGGEPVDVVLGYDTPEEYLSQDGCLGAVIGRCANRIAGAAFTLNGRTYSLEPNQPPNTLHGGSPGYHQRLWELRARGENAVVCSLRSPSGDQGFPGALEVTVTYTLEQGALSVDYEAAADADTVVNLTNHSYFNLDGHAAGRVDHHIVRIDAQRYTPADASGIPTGELRDVAGTPLDLRAATALHERLSHPALAPTRGYDHNYVAGADFAARVYSPLTGILLAMDTDLPGVQFYTAGFLTPRRGKSGAVYQPRQGLCLESQYPPNAVNTPAFPSPVLAGGQTWRGRARFAFSTIS